MIDTCNQKSGTNISQDFKSIMRIGLKAIFDDNSGIILLTVLILNI